MLETIASFTIVQIISFAGLGGFIDALMNKEMKHKVGAYLFGSRQIDPSEFESSVVTGLVRIFCRNDDIDRLSLWRILGFAVFIQTVLVAAVFAYADGNVIIRASDLAVISLLAIGAFCLEYFSLNVTKRLFYFRVHPPLKHLLFIFLDILISSLIPFVIYYNHYHFIPWNDFTRQLLIPIFLMAITASIINAIQLLAWIIGNFIRLVAKPFSERFIDQRFVYSAPFTVMFLITAIMVGLVEAIIG